MFSNVSSTHLSNQNSAATKIQRCYRGYNLEKYAKGFKARNNPARFEPDDNYITLYRGIAHRKTAKRICKTIESSPKTSEAYAQHIDEKKNTFVGLASHLHSKKRFVSPEKFKKIARGRGCLPLQGFHSFSSQLTRLTPYTSWTPKMETASFFAGIHSVGTETILLEMKIHKDDPRIVPKRLDGMIGQGIWDCMRCFSENRSEKEYYINPYRHKGKNLPPIEISCVINVAGGGYGADRYSTTLPSF